MERSTRQRCTRLALSLDKIKSLDPGVYEDTLYLLAAVYATETENDELRGRLKEHPEPHEFALLSP